MLIPSARVLFGDLLEHLAEDDCTEVTISRDTFNQLLRLYVSCWQFDQEWYLKTYPDIKQGISEGTFLSPFAHFVSVGYFEGRLPSAPFVDEAWYLSKYPDIAAAVIEGRIASAKEHFIQFGYTEGRVPCDPQLNPKWYAPRFLPNQRTDDTTLEQLKAHFVDHGYRQFAVPLPPR